MTLSVKLPSFMPAKKPKGTAKSQDNKAEGTVRRRVFPILSFIRSNTGALYWREMPRSKTKADFSHLRY